MREVESRMRTLQTMAAKSQMSHHFIFNAFNTIAAFSFFIIVYHMFSGDASAAGVWPTLFGSLASLVTTFVVIPTVAWMSRKLGKKRAFVLSQGISIIGYVMLWFLFVPGKPYMFIFALPFFSFGIGSLFTLMMSMTADVMDLDELEGQMRLESIDHQPGPQAVGRRRVDRRRARSGRWSWSASARSAATKPAGIARAVPLAAVIAATVSPAADESMSLTEPHLPVVRTPDTSTVSGASPAGGNTSTTGSSGSG